MMPQASSSHEQSLHINLLWAQGNWPQLAALLDHSATLTEQERAYVAVALMQEGHIADAKALLQGIMSPKKSKTVSEQDKTKIERTRLAAILLAGCYTSLAKAHFIQGEADHAKDLLSQAVRLTEPALLQASTEQLRSGWQQQQLANFFKQSHAHSDFSVKTLNVVEMGEVWAGNTVNTVIFRHHGIFTHGDYQYTSFYVDKQTLRVAQRHLPSNTMVYSDILGSYNIKDAHNSISMGMDRAGYIHISYDHHGTQLKYRRSVTPYCIEAFTDELEMTGQREKKVTYPAFLMPMPDEPLQLLYRDGSHQKGAAYAKFYSEAEQRWFDAEQSILAGDSNQPWTSNAYWNHPVRDNEGNGHLSFIWRTHHIGEEQQINNMNICYAKTYDNGKSWVSSNHKPFKLPITQVNAEVVWPVSPASNLINQTSMATDSKNLPHIVFYANDEHGVVQYQHLWFNGKKWQHQIISNRTQAFNLYGGGTLRIPISRPEIVIDHQDNIYVIYRGDLSNDCMAALCLKAPDYTYSPDNQEIIFPEPLGLAEPVIDRLRWQQTQVLSMLLQYNDQPDHDVGHASVVKPIYLIDVVFNA